MHHLSSSGVGIGRQTPEKHHSGASLNDGIWDLAPQKHVFGIIQTASAI